MSEHGPEINGADVTLRELRQAESRFTGEKGATMKIGFAGYPVPPEVSPDGAMEWTVGEAARLGVQIIGGDPRTVFGWDTRQYDLGYLRHVRDLGDAQGVEIEPYVGGMFDLVGWDASEARQRALASIRAAKVLGGPYMRTGYGQLQIESSRFNPMIPVREHLDRLVANLRGAARLADDAGIVIAVENHCDFTGRELADVLEAVGSPAIKAALDTGNSLTVFCDPRDDLRALAPLSVTMHLKDMAVFPSGVRGLVPFRAVGCVIGEGIVDIREAIRALTSEGPRGAEIPLIIETGWPLVGEGEDSGDVRRRILQESVVALRTMLTEAPKAAGGGA